MHIRPRATAIPVAIAIAVVIVAGSGGDAAAADPSIVVAPGDTLTAIASRQGVSVEEIAALNGLPDPDRIFVGQRLQLVADSSAPTSDAPGATPAAGTHLVAPGENLTWIAARYGTTIDALVAANGIVNASLIFAGQQLVIPGAPAPVQPAPAEPVPATPAPAEPVGAPPAPDEPVASPSAVAAPALAWQEHLVAPGENLTWIAARYGVTIAEIVAANGIADPSFIRAGEVIRIATAAVAPLPAAAPAATAPAGPDGIPEWMAGPTAARDDVRQMIVAEAQAMGVPPALALAVAWHESGWQQAVVSSAGAVGVMQLLPTTGEWVADAMLGEPVDINDARSNVRAGVRLLAHYLARYGGDRTLVLAAYYQGQRATDEHGVYPMTLPYVASIVALEAIFAR